MRKRNNTYSPAYTYTVSWIEVHQMNSKAMSEKFDSEESALGFYKNLREKKNAYCRTLVRRDPKTDDTCVWGHNHWDHIWYRFDATPFRINSFRHKPHDE